MKRLSSIYKNFLYLLLIFSISCSVPDGNEYYAVEKYPLCLIQSDGTNYSELSEDGYGGATLWFILDDTKILIIWADDIYHFDINSQELKFILNVPFTALRSPTLSPDRSSVIFVASDQNGEDLYKVDINGSNLKNLTNSPGTYERFPSFSEDGKKIIFTTFSDFADQTISYYDLEKESVFQIISHPDDHRVINWIIYFWYPVFGDNDNIIYYIKPTENVSVSGDSLFYYDSSYKIRKLLDSQASFTGRLFMSANRERLIYLKHGEPCALAAIDSHGGNSNILDNYVFNDCEYEISQSGDKVLYWYSNTENYEKQLFIVNSDGSNKINLASGKNASFSLDGEKIVFTGYKKIVYD